MPVQVENIVVIFDDDIATCDHLLKVSALRIERKAGEIQVAF